MPPEARAHRLLQHALILFQFAQHLGTLGAKLLWIVCESSYKCLHSSQAVDG